MKINKKYQKIPENQPHQKDSFVFMQVRVYNRLPPFTEVEKGTKETKKEFKKELNLCRGSAFLDL